jgi:hypothetical protein
MTLHLEQDKITNLEKLMWILLGQTAAKNINLEYLFSL